MKLFLEEEVEENGEKSIIIVKSVKDISEAIKAKTLNKCFLHKCRHDEDPQGPCSREEI